jgi:hypothetical protein
VLVMLGDIPPRSTANMSPETLRRNQLSLYYPTSGLYRNDCSIVPLWTMPYISWRAAITLSSDGHHLIAWGEWPADPRSYRDLALAFYEDGQLLVAYKVKDLVRRPRTLPHTVSHYQWLLNKRLDDSKGILTVETLNKEHYVFDVTTGAIVSAIVPTVTPDEGGRADPVPVSTSVAWAPERQHYVDDTSVTNTLVLGGDILALLLAGVSAMSRRKRAVRRWSNTRGY